MAQRLLGVLLGMALLAGGVAVAFWATPHATTALSLHRFEQEAPTEVVHGSARQGGGLLGLDVVTLDDERIVEVARQGEPRVQWQRPEFLVGEHGARYADEPASDGAWRPFALRAGVGALLVVLLLGASLAAFLRARGVFDRLGFTVFGQRDPDARPVGWVPGSGSHGGGCGQVPPHVPYDADWDPDRRIR
jgi:hypothetical protein